MCQSALRDFQVVISGLLFFVEHFFNNEISPIKNTILFAALLGLLPFSAAHADGCLDEIRRLFDKGPMDSFSAPPHRYTSQTIAADGTVRYTTHATIETPTRSMAGLEVPQQGHGTGACHMLWSIG